MAPGLHPRHHGAGAEEGAGQVDLQRAAPGPGLERVVTQSREMQNILTLLQKRERSVNELPRSLKVSLYQAFLDAVVSENVMRMVAMKAASDNAQSIIEELQLIYNKSRQAAITKELSEIVGGAAAV